MLDYESCPGLDRVDWTAERLADPSLDELGENKGGIHSWDMAPNCGKNLEKDDEEGAMTAEMIAKAVKWGYTHQEQFNAKLRKRYGKDLNRARDSNVTAVVEEVSAGEQDSAFALFFRLKNFLTHQHSFGHPDVADPEIVQMAFDFFGRQKVCVFAFKESRRSFLRCSVCDVRRPSPQGPRRSKPPVVQIQIYRRPIQAE